MIASGIYSTVSMVVANERRSRGGLDEPIKPVVNGYGKYGSNKARRQWHPVLCQPSSAGVWGSFSLSAQFTSHIRL